MNSVADSQAFSIYLPVAAHQKAEQHRQLQSNAQRGEQVYFNALAIYVVNYYLRCLGIPTDWAAGNSRNLAKIPFLDVADLMINGVGRLECRPVLLKATALEISMETWSDRIGYIAVQFSDTLKEARILGFISTTQESMPLRELWSLEAFIFYLGQLSQSPVSLRQWLTSVVNQGWQLLYQILTLTQLANAFRSRNQIEMTREQVVDLGLQMGKQSLALALTVTAADELTDATEVEVWARAYPVGQDYLLPRVQLIVGDEAGIHLESCSRDADDFVQQEFMALSGEAFSVTIALADARLTKTFMVYKRHDEWIS